MGHTKIITIRQASDPVFDAQFLCDRLRAELKQRRARRPSKRKSRGECCLPRPRVSFSGRRIDRVARHSVTEILLVTLVDRYCPEAITQIEFREIRSRGHPRFQIPNSRQRERPTRRIVLIQNRRIIAAGSDLRLTVWRRVNHDPRMDEMRLGLIDPAERPSRLAPLHLLGYHPVITDFLLRVILEKGARRDRFGHLRDRPLSHERGHIRVAPLFPRLGTHFHIIERARPLFFVRHFRGFQIRLVQTRFDLRVSQSLCRREYESQLPDTYRCQMICWTRLAFDHPRALQSPSRHDSSMFPNEGVPDPLPSPRDEKRGGCTGPFIPHFRCYLRSALVRFGSPHSSKTLYGERHISLGHVHPRMFSTPTLGGLMQRNRFDSRLADEIVRTAPPPNNLIVVSIRQVIQTRQFRLRDIDHWRLTDTRTLGPLPPLAHQPSCSLPPGFLRAGSAPLPLASRLLALCLCAACVRVVSPLIRLHLSLTARIFAWRCTEPPLSGGLLTTLHGRRSIGCAKVLLGLIR